MHRSPLDYRVEPAADTDTAFIRDSWSAAYRESPRCARWPGEAYSAFMREQMTRLLGRSTVLVARPVDWAEGILGWACGEQRDDEFALHFGYTKPPFRRQGIGWALVDAMEPRGRLVFSHLRPPFTNTLKKRGYAFDRDAAK